jgi:hypothetical protein
MGNNLTEQLRDRYPGLFEPATAHAADYAGYPDVQNSILLERDARILGGDLRGSIGNLVTRTQFVTLEEERLAA